MTLDRSIMNYLTLFWISLIVQITVVFGKAHLRVRLSNFEGDGRDYDGNKCDYFFAGNCDPLFQLCVASHEHQNFGNANENCIIKDETNHRHNVDRVSGTIMSAQKTLDSWHGVRVWVRAWDEDPGRDDYIDTFRQDLSLRPYQEEDGSREKTLIPTRGERPENHITISFDVYCLRDYYSATCGVWCVEQDSDQSGHYTCHPMDGYKICRKDYYDNTTAISCTRPVLNCEEEGLGYCKNGICANDQYTFRCDCHPGWEGDDCSIDINECLSEPCQNGGTCVNQENSYQCTCPPAFTGPHCETKMCDVEDPCNTGVCKGALECECTAFYSGNRCQYDNCENGATASGDTCICRTGFKGPFCETNIDDCVNHKCKNGAICRDYVNTYRCECVNTEREVYIGGFCQHILCAYDNPCKNGGTCYGLKKCDCPPVTAGTNCETCLCQNGICSGDVCQCEPGFTGEFCDVNMNECDSNPCLNGGTCEDQLNGYSCICDTSDYYKHYTGSKCQDVICDIRDPCLNEGTCYGNSSCDCKQSFNGDRCETCQCAPNGQCSGDTCICDLGFTGQYCETDINECDSNPCKNGGTCENQIGRYNCLCDTSGTGPSGHIYTGPECQHTHCNLTNPCVNGACYGNGQCYCGDVYAGTTCDQCLCQNGGTCSGNRCLCVPGYTAIHCETEIDECTSNPCQNDGTCTNELNGYTCECVRNEKDVFTGKNCDKTVCEETNPCTHGECYGNGLCRCKPMYDDGAGCTTCQCDHGRCGQTGCVCEPGYTGDLCETNTDECSSNPCWNGGTCKDEVNGYTCVCDEAYQGENCQTSKCENQNPCLHNGICSGDRQCECAEIYAGTTCETCLCNNGDCDEAICECDPGWKGKLCDEEIDECAPGPCKNGGTCRDQINGYTCNCDNSGYDHFTGSQCQFTVCSQNNPCKSGGSCFGNSECGCLDIYDGDTCEDCLCARGDCVAADCQCEPGYTGKFCETEIDECASSPCLNEGVCVNNINSFSCDCSQIPGPQAYTGSRCEYTKCSLNNPCQNDGVCYGDSQCQCSEVYSGDRCEKCNCVKGFCSEDTCLCEAGYTGKFCETEKDECSSNPCKNGGFCIDKVNSFECRCDNSGTHHYTGDTCHSTVCSINDPCGERGTCYADGKCDCLDIYDGEDCTTCKCVNGYCEKDKCICYAGYEGDLCDRDTNECASNPCQNGGTCHNELKQYTCECSTDSNHLVHYTGTNCEISQCTITNSCKNGGTCYRSSECLCPEIFTGNQCESCLCDKGTCLPGGSCKCDAGYTGTLCDVDVNDCSSNPCKNGGSCKDLLNSYECECVTSGSVHYTGKNCDVSVCEVDNNCKNGGTCYEDSDCLCHTIYGGETCEICNCVHGQCDGEKCTCDPGYTGGLCDVELCSLVTCHNGGTCVDGVCSCSPGFGGVYCGEKTTPVGSDNIVTAQESTSGDGGGEVNPTILGIVLGFLALIALVILAALYCRNRNKKKKRTRTMSTQAFVQEEEQNDGTQTEPNGENEYENIGSPGFAIGPPLPAKQPFTNFKPPAYLAEKGSLFAGPLPSKDPPSESYLDDPFDSADELPDIVPAVHPPLYRSLSDQSSLKVVPQRTGFPGNSVKNKRRASLAKDMDLTESANFQMSGTVWNPSYKRRDSANMYTNC